MWGAIKSILGGGDIVKQGIGLIDDMHTSTEEEISAKTEAKVKLLQAYAPFKLAQRILMLMFASTFLFSFFLCLGFTLAYIFGYVIVAEGVEPVAEILSLLDAFYIGEIMLMIVVFYFGGGAAEGIITRSREKNPQ